MAANNHNGAQACQQVLGVRENVVVGTRSCDNIEETASTAYSGAGWPVNPNWASDDARQLAQLMLDKIHV